MSLVRPLSTPCLNNPIKKYNQASKGHDTRHEIKEERAPSTAEVIKKMAEEKLREAEQGVASQVSDKTYDATEEATLGEAKLNTVKNRYKEREPGADFRRRGDDDRDDKK
ncbi:hypothetical protein TorRG33x02_122380 [Trema orientale]|uniref:Uncharacterized protein n=1 Tax=Trema orientale TaxID=63057 RepID=A0A2P5F276_TREOI|nr:hypothetical protein TorRG33x02_122380 [Trema orientale]